MPLADEISELKQYVQNFHDVSEIYREIAEADLRYLQSKIRLKELRKDDDLIEFGFVVLFLLCLAVLLYSLHYGCIMFCCLGGIHYLLESASASALASEDLNAVKKLIKLRESKATAIKDLAQTL